MQLICDLAQYDFHVAGIADFILERVVDETFFLCIQQCRMDDAIPRFFDRCGERAEHDGDTDQKQKITIDCCSVLRREAVVDQ